MNRLLTPFFCLFVLAGCASADLLREAETPEQKYWASLHIFDVYDQAALEVAQDINTPVTVKQTLKRSRNVAKQALLVADEAYKILQEARASLDAVPDETNLDKVNAALVAFNRNAQRAFHQVNAFKSAVDDFQE
jgi:hypothetical protein